MKLPLLLLAFIFSHSAILFSAELEESNVQFVEITLQQLFPDNDATAFFEVEENDYMYEEDVHDGLDLSATNILKITGKRSFLVSVEGIENLTIRINDEIFKASDVVRELTLHGNALTSLPDMLSTFDLSHLSIANNNFQFVPAVIYDLLNKKLNSLNLSNNRIQCLPKNYLMISSNILAKITYFNIEKNLEIDRNVLIQFIARIPRDHLNMLLAQRRIVYDVIEDTNG